MQARVIAPLAGAAGGAQAASREGRGDQGAVLRHADDAHMSAHEAPETARGRYDDICPGLCRSGRRRAVVLPRRAGRDGAARAGPCGPRGVVARRRWHRDGRGAADLGSITTRRLWLDPAADAGARLDRVPLRRTDRAGDAAGDVRVALSLPDLATLPAGTDEAPESAATVDPASARLRGRDAAIGWPGPACASRRLLSVDGLPAGFRQRLGGAITRCSRAASTSSCAPAHRSRRCRAASRMREA